MIEVALFISGLVAGAINAIAGGGILFVFPVLLAAGLNPLHAAMTSVNAGWPGAITSVFGYRKELSKAPEKYFYLAIPAVVGSGTGAYFLTQTPNTTFESIVPWLILFSISLFAFQPQLHRHIHKPAQLRKISPMFLLCMLLFPVALYGGYYGAGFGFIILAILGFTKLKNVYQIMGMKNVLTAAISLTCTIIFALNHGIVWHYALAPMSGSIIGGVVGSKLAHKLSPHITRMVVIIAGLVIVVILLTRNT